MSRNELLADLEAERSLLGACLLSDAAIDTSSAIVVPADFRIPKHQQVYAHMVQMRENGERVDVVTVAAKFDEQSAFDFLHEIQNTVPSISAAKQYARIIAGWAVRRRLVFASAQIAEMATGAADVDMDPTDMVQEAMGYVSDIDIPPGTTDPDVDVDTFVADVNVNHEWLVEGFLEYRDRMLLSGLEGSGKSVLMRQIAVKVAAGIHPWTDAPVVPRNVLYVDLENSNRQIARALAGLRRTAGSSLDPNRLRVISRPGGLNLSARSDKRWLIERCDVNETDLLVIGPVYRMSAGVAERGDIGGEDQARTVTAALDEIRIHCNVALLMETHAPHGSSSMGRDLRPFGSSVWLRWPEFGVGLRPDDPDGSDDYYLEHWRGPRDEREWPRKLTKRGYPWMWTVSEGYYRR